MMSDGGEEDLPEKEGNSLAAKLNINELKIKFKNSIKIVVICNNCSSDSGPQMNVS